MRVIAARDRGQFAEFLRHLDPGEADAIVVALELWAPLILIDEGSGLGMIRRAEFFMEMGE